MKATITILIMMFMGACAADAVETSTTTQAVAGPDAHCVLCGEDPGGGDGGGGGIVVTTENWLDANYPGWAFGGGGGISCRVTADGNDCSASFWWFGELLDAGCVLLGDGTHVCG